MPARLPMSSRESEELPVLCVLCDLLGLEWLARYRQVTPRRRVLMRTRLIQLAAVLALVAMTAYGPATAGLAGAVETSPSLSSIGPLTFAPDGTVYAAGTA